MTKKEMIDWILEDIHNNEYNSLDLLYQLAKEALENMNKEDLKEYYFSNN